MTTTTTGLGWASIIAVPVIFVICPQFVPTTLSPTICITEADLTVWGRCGLIGTNIRARHLSVIHWIFLSSNFINEIVTAFQMNRDVFFQSNSIDCINCFHQSSLTEMSVNIRQTCLKLCLSIPTKIQVYPCTKNAYHWCNTKHLDTI